MIWLFLMIIGPRSLVDLRWNVATIAANLTEATRGLAGFPMDQQGQIEVHGASINLHGLFLLSRTSLCKTAI